MFAEVPSDTIEAGDDHAAAELRALWRRLDQIVIMHGGVVDKHMGDVMMAVFGMPVAAENDADRAVRCALALGQLVDTSRAGSTLTGLTIRVGINTGPVSAGTVGSDGKTTVIGDMVNVASRLRETAGANTVVVSENTHRLVAPFYEFEPLGPQQIKGRQTPVNAYLALAARPRLFFTSGRGIEGITAPMIGRYAELAYLQSAVLSAIDESQGQLVLISGEGWREVSPGRRA
ncbi:MAG: adenylate/guanylate cyclase domain-containing protein [Chloroflexota bacterium]